MRSKLLPVFILICLYLTKPVFSQHTYYVTKSGKDSNSGLSINNSFLTLQKAADIVSKGDSVIVLEGNYKGFDIRTGGFQNSPIVFKAVNHSVIIDEHNYKTNDGINIENADWIVIDGFKVINQPRAGIRAAVSDFVVIKNNYCSQNNYWGIFTGFTNDIIIENNVCSYSLLQHGIYVSNSGDRPIVRNNECFGNNGCGIQLNADASQGGDGIITNALINGNILHDNGTGGGSAINLDGVQNSAMYNNLVYNNHATGIALFKIDGAEGSKNNKVYNNTIINPTDARWTMLISNGSTGDTLYNNIFINHHNFRGSISIDASSINNFFSDYNIVVNRLSTDDGESNMSLTDWQKLGYDLHSRTANPEEQLFTGPAENDFNLIDGSQAINAGTSIVSDIVSNDITGVPRPQGERFDIGAYEYSVAAGISKEETFNTFHLSQNYPNPFNPSTKIRYYIPEVCFVSLKIYDILGREIETLVNEEQAPGLHEVIFSADSGFHTINDFASGIYICRLSAGSYSAEKKLMFLK